MAMHKWTAHRIHRWAGLISALWLAVLGVTGFFLDHREWRWMWQNGISVSFLPSQIVEKSHNGVLRLYQNVNKEHHLVGGNTGLWWKHGEQQWQATRFEGDTPQVKTLTHISESSWWLETDQGWWLATDNGVWLSTDNGKTAGQFALANQLVTSLVQSDVDKIWGIVDRSRVFKLDIATRQVEWIALAGLSEALLPESIDLSRLVHDVHFGRGIFSAPWSLLLSDLSAIALFVLPVTGFMYWWLPRLWRRKRKQGLCVNKEIKQRWAIWLYRFHAPVVGLVCVLPIVYLSITGIFLDHSSGLRNLMKQTRLHQSILPPVYNLPNWDNQIYSLLLEKGNTKHFSLGTRLGLFSTDDSGQSWQRESLQGKASSFIWTSRQFKEQQFIGGMGGPNYFRKSKNNQWVKLPHGAHMPTDVTLTESGQSLWKTQKGLKLFDENGYTDHKIILPKQNYVPWYYIFDGLHSGLLIHEQWKWLNDFFAIMAMFLVITGLIRWWRVKWL